MGSWLPLESNPEVLNPFVRRLGLPPDWGFCDVFGLDPELLLMVPQPCAAVCLLYPSQKISKPRREELACKAAHQPPVPADLFFCQQYDGIGNACGTIACMHAVANAAASSHFTIPPDGPLAKFIEVTKASPTPTARGKALLEAKDLQEMSDATAAAGETEGAGTDDAQNQHFISFVNFNDMIYELDGRNITDGVATPVCHGATTPDSFLTNVAKIVQEQFMARDPENVNFNLVALCKTE
mmetsp:Transcript_12686/g.32396  ORF Transcript_12686/g.32396 Transcript_12686/m.32396 type:complete len:240 (+) Transcript_12686:81-800(+)